jgi:hypothetical protein
MLSTIFWPVAIERPGKGEGLKELKKPTKLSFFRPKNVLKGDMRYRIDRISASR